MSLMGHLKKVEVRFREGEEKKPLERKFRAWKTCLAVRKEGWEFGSSVPDPRTGVFKHVCRWQLGRIEPK